MIVVVVVVLFNLSVGDEAFSYEVSPLVPMNALCLQTLANGLKEGFLIIKININMR